MAGSHHTMSSRRKGRSRSKSLVRARKRKGRRERQQQNKQADNTTLVRSRNRFQVERPPPTLFQVYQQTQGWLAAEEFPAFFHALRQPLAVSFRLRTASAMQEWKDLVREQQKRRRAHYHHPHPLYVRSLHDVIPGAVQVSRSVLYHDPVLQSWLNRATQAGQVSRQELVSMLPVHLLDIQPHHAVLDLCASPGSKTVQIVDALYANQTNDRGVPHGSATEGVTGFCVANELDPKRAYVLAHRCVTTLQERMVSLCITSHNAAKFPNVLAPLQKKDSTSQGRQPKHESRPFDRIVCDVPCSGDGTLRKDTKVWKTWHPEYGIDLHQLQLRIAKRGIALLKIGGLMTYSTCSFHPIENEAVVAALLQTGTVEVVNMAQSNLATRVKACPGLTQWHALNDACEILSPDSLSTPPRWPTTLWPPSPMDQSCAQQLRHCLRLLPQYDADGTGMFADTGGFFIALLRKIKDFPAGPSKGPNDMQQPVVKTVTPAAKHHQLYPCQTHYNDKDRDDNSVVFTRSPSGGRRFSISSPLTNFLKGEPGSAKINLVYAGREVK